MKSILFIFNGLTKSNGNVGISGGDIRVAEIVKNLDNSKYDINILTTSNGEELLNKFNIPYTNKYIINYSVTSGIFSNLIISIKSFFELPEELKKYKKGIVYSSCEHLYDVLPALKLKLLNNCEWFAVYHWVENYPWREKRGNTPFLRRYVYWLNRAFSGWLIKKFSDKVLAVSEQTKEKLIDIKKININKIKVVYCGVDYKTIIGIGKKFLTEKESKYDAVYMKRLNNGKGIFDLLEIWKLVCVKNKNAKLAVVGDGPESVVIDIRNFINKNNLNDNIFLLGVIYDIEKKFRILNSSKLFILPSHEENWAISIGEAMAIKLPVLCYNLKEIRPIWRDNVEWIKFGAINDFSNKIINYLDNSELRNNISGKAFNFIKRYNWEKISKEEFN
ncbi:MAG TPA: hypothetical protein DEB09_04075 [Candidatus Magasanikbacteria bacterium]|nr:hypothetical protein [Candidatus Magasanikbacteria bacterium]